MGVEYTVNGSIPLKGRKRDLERAVKKLHEEVDDPDFNADLVDNKLYIDSYTTTFGAQDRINEAIPAFAAKWASEPTFLNYECEGERDEWLVGPEGFDETQAKIDHIDNQISALQEERESLVKRRELDDE